jgi:hypothetical protein
MQHVKVVKSASRTGRLYLQESMEGSTCLNRYDHKGISLTWEPHKQSLCIEAEINDCCYKKGGTIVADGFAWMQLV